MAHTSPLWKISTLAGLLLLVGATGPSLHYHTYVNATYGTGLGTAGELVVRYGDDGRVAGTWRQQDEATTATVYGSRHGADIALDIGTRFHITARVATDGSMAGTAVSDDSNEPLTFSATPEVLP